MKKVTITISGEAGSGKTTLLKDIVTTLALKGANYSAVDGGWRVDPLTVADFSSFDKPYDNREVEIRTEEMPKTLSESTAPQEKGAASLLGSKVKDRVSGFTGIAVSEHTYLNGCKRVTVQPLIDKDGKLPEAETFDMPQLQVIKAGAAECEPTEGRTGGPEKFSDCRKY